MEIKYCGVDNKKMTLVELLNKLIEKGWKPFWWDNQLSSLHKEDGEWYIRFHNWMDSELFDLRQLTSKESWLWQFCVLNNLIDYSQVRAYWISFAPIDIPITELQNYDNVHRLLRDCASLDEDKLEDFLLSIIKI